MFDLSKIFWLILNPGNLFILFLFSGTVLLFTKFYRTGRLFVSASVVFALLVTIFPVGGRLIENLENRFPANVSIPPDIDGIIVLGGTINQYLTFARGQPALSEGGERLTEFVYLARRYPNAKLIFSGGSGALIDRELKEADAARMFFSRMGIAGDRIVYEGDSRNTYENAVFSRRIAGDTAKTGRWVLVTSALHMPRAMGVFRGAGWNVLAYPVDYSTDGQGRFEIGFQPISALSQLNRAMREWIGLFAYRILGRTSTIAPSANTLPDN
jgi:uncharacterized SAM-binding protein YcdF (DUF218 family)